MYSCPQCGARTLVIDTRGTPRGTRRRRKCRKCAHRFTTFEVDGEFRLVPTPPTPPTKKPDAGGP